MRFIEIFSTKDVTIYTDCQAKLRTLQRKKSKAITSKLDTSCGKAQSNQEGKRTLDQINIPNLPMKSLGDIIRVTVRTEHSEK